jgi:hypothetical protein
MSNGKQYYIQEPKPDGTIKHVLVCDKPGVDLTPIIARHGELLEKVPPVVDTSKTPANNAPTTISNPTASTVAPADKEIFIKVPVTLPDGTTVDDYVSLGVPPSGAKLKEFVEKELGRPLTNADKLGTKPVQKGETASIAILSNALETGAPVTFSDGTVLETPFFTEGAAYVNDVVDTTKFITDQVVLAAEFAALKGIEMSVDEVKMAYILNSVANNTEVPDDVEMEVIPTILDRIHDTYY